MCPDNADYLAALSEAGDVVTEPFVVGCDLDGVIWRGDRTDPGRGRGGRRTARRRPAGRVPHQQLEQPPSRRWPRSSRASASTRRSPTSRRARRRRPRCSPPTARRARGCLLRGTGRDRGGRRTRVSHRRRRSGRRGRGGLAPRFRLRGDAAGSDAIRGARFIATNLDPTYPSAGGCCPAPVRSRRRSRPRAGRQPIVAGKPEAADGRAGVRAVRQDRRRGRRSPLDRRQALRPRSAGRSRFVLSGVAGPGGEEEVPNPPRLRRHRLAGLAPQLLAAS